MSVAETGSHIQSKAIEGLCDLRALALAGRAMSKDANNDDLHNMGRVLGKIADLADDLIRQLDIVLINESTHLS